MNITIIGASSPTGRLLTQALRTGRSGEHHLTLLVRDASRVDGNHPRTRIDVGDATDPEVVASAIADADCVVLLVGAPRGTSVGTVREDAAKALVAAAQRRPTPPRVVAVSALGGAQSSAQLSWFGRMIYRRVVGADRLAQVDRQEAVLAASGLQGVVVRPPKLDDAPATQPQVVAGRVRSAAVLHRGDLAAFLGHQTSATTPGLAFTTVVSSG